MYWNRNSFKMKYFMETPNLNDSVKYKATTAIQAKVASLPSSVMSRANHNLKSKEWESSVHTPIVAEEQTASCVDDSARLHREPQFGAGKH